MADKIRWGIIGAGGIARAFASAVPHSKTGVMSAAASRSLEKAEAFGEEMNVPKRFGSYQEMLDGSDVDAVYIATPHPMHLEWAVRAAEAGKHILCEKPMGINHAEAQFIVEAARRHDVFLMEAFMYRCNPLTVKLCELIKDRVVGDVRLIRSTFSFHSGYNLEGRLLNNELGGGGILDVGCYPVSMARLIAGAASGRPFLDPVEVKGTGHVGEESRCDEWAVASLKFPGDIIAQCATGVQLGVPSEAVVYGAEGRIIVASPWFACGREGGTAVIRVERNGEEPKDVEVTTAGWLYGIEADMVGENIKRREGQWPAMTQEDTLGNMRTLDLWREEVGVTYRQDSEEYCSKPLAGLPIKKRDECRMPYGRLPGLEKDISRLVLGTTASGGLLDTAVICDEFFARGGNCMDTAYVYGPARSKALGFWMKTRGVRDDMVVIAKGAHTPKCFPQYMKEELQETLDLMDTGYTDIYFMHRDNADVPVDEWIDALNEEVDAGRMRVFGGSNWTMERIAAANEYAEKTGKQGFAAVSNNFALARMIKAPWGGCLASSEPAPRKWHEKTQFPLFPWSSQAQGFFAPGRSAPDKRNDANLVRCWYSEDNFQRKDRLYELAEKKGVDAMAIGLRYVLDQPFPIWPLVGPGNLSEMRSSFKALECEPLTAKELEWLDLKA